MSPPAPVDYSRPFWIEEPVGNNAFAFGRRGESPRLRVPSIIAGTWADVRTGADVAFEDLDEHHVLRSCRGLAHFVRTTWDDVPTVVVDNHNHAFYFWIEALQQGVLAPGATLVHLDQHRDTREPARRLPAGGSLADAFRYTNFQLNVGNYIVPAQQAGIVGEVLLVTGSERLADRSVIGRPNLVLNIDLDFFAPEMSYVGFERVLDFVDAHRRTAALITIATSPFFIDQDLAITALKRLVRNSGG